MFQPPVFHEERVDVMHELIRSRALATLVSSVQGELSADHVPLVLKQNEQGGFQLEGHIAAANPLFRHRGDDMPVLAIFQGPQSYVTPSWYASKKEHGKVVPTWNYVVVHARGVLNFTRDSMWLLKHLEELTSQHEGNREEPWSVSDAPDDFIQRQFRALTGFTIEIKDLQGTWKVSQNKQSHDAAGVQHGLSQSGTVDGNELASLVAACARR